MTTNITINNNQGSVAMMVPRMVQRHRWSHRLRLPFGLNVYFTNCRMKKSPVMKDRFEIQGDGHQPLWKTKHELYKKVEGRCEVCGKEVKYRNMQMHHVLPYGRFPDLSLDPRNIMLVCCDCHKEIHQDPYRNIQLMEEKAKELNIELNDRYGYRKETTELG